MLRQSKGKLLFKSEALLEEFIWLNLKPLLNLQQVKKQYFINKQNRSDILAANSEGRLAILELKKGGGKASIDQLLRYQKFLIQESPQETCFEAVDCKNPFVKIAIASNFSRQTIDYARQKIPDCLLLTYEVKLYKSGEYWLILKNLDGDIFSKAKIDIIEDSLFESLPSFLQGYLLDKPEIRERILSITQKILSYHSEIRFEETANYVGRINKEVFFAKFDRKGEIITDKICASFILFPEEKTLTQQFKVCVYLPTVEFKHRQGKWKKLIDQIEIETTDFIHVNRLLDYSTILHLDGGFRLNYPFRVTGFSQDFDNFQDYYIHYRKYMKSRQKLRSVDASDFTLVDRVIDMALEDWSVR